MWEDLRKIRYAVEVDVEGYPMMEGYRVDDEGLLKTLFTHLRLYDEQHPKSPLVTECEGELCFWQPFDAPLVGQSVEILPKGSAKWNFLGGLSYEVPYDQMEEDEWHRLHAWVGPQQIPAVLSRKAQAALLNGSELEPIKVTRFRSNMGVLDQSAVTWGLAYKDKEDGWEMHTHTPLLEKESYLLASGSQVMVPGCGRGHDAAFLAQKGYEVTALDYAEPAIEAATKRYGNLGVRWIREDVFEYLNAHPGQMDAIFEHTFFCAFPPHRRSEYISHCAKALKPNGLLFGVFFVKTHRGGPPFGLSQWELNQYIHPYFKIKAWHISKESITPRLSQELWVVLEKK